VNLVWVRGHVGTELNEMADEWANKARLGERL
jgi:ribonuclease HI